jgi:hypothetical protein
VIRLLMTEAALMGVLGGVGALIVARAALGALLTTMPADDAARMPFELNGTVLSFTLALSLGTSVLFGLLPAVHALRRVVASGGHPQPGRVSDLRSTTRFRTALATAQIALATALLAQAGLFITSLVNVARVELGIRREGVISFRLAPYLNGYTQERAPIPLLSARPSRSAALHTRSWASCRPHSAAFPRRRSGHRFARRSPTTD